MGQKPEDLEGCCNGEARDSRKGSQVGVNAATWVCGIGPVCERQREDWNSTQDGMKGCSHNNQYQLTRSFRNMSAEKVHIWYLFCTFPMWGDEWEEERDVGSKQSRWEMKHFFKSRSMHGNSSLRIRQRVGTELILPASAFSAAPLQLWSCPAHNFPQAPWMRSLDRGNMVALPLVRRKPGREIFVVRMCFLFCSQIKSQGYPLSFTSLPAAILHSRWHYTCSYCPSNFKWENQLSTYAQEGRWSTTNILCMKE